jgi:hypothetical protein
MLIWVSYTAKSVFSLFNPTTPIKDFLSVSQYHLYFEWVINEKKIKTQTTRNSIPRKSAKT